MNVCSAIVRDALVSGTLVCALLFGCSLTNRVDEDLIPAARPPTEVCDDGIDNDNDGEIDCEDHNCRDVDACQENSSEKCSDGTDNDLDGLVDCEEAECLQFAYCQESDEASCSDREDNDHDGLVDCREDDCKGFAHCQEATELACQDRLDNDEDGLTDCNDESCARFFACFSTTPLEQEQGCEVPLRLALSIDDEFGGDEIDAAKWDVFHSAGTVGDRPGLYEGGLDLNGRDGFGRAGISSVARFQVGRDQSFGITVFIRAYTGCTESTCEVTVELHTRREWGDFFADGQSVASLRLRGLEGSAALAIDCGYHDERLDADGATVDIVDGGIIRLSVAYDPSLRRIAYSVAGVQVCLSPVIMPSEPPTSLVLHSSGPARNEAPEGPPNLLMVDEVRLDLEGQVIAARCAGVGQPVVPDGFCDPERIHNAGVRSPRTVRRGSGDSADWHMFPDLLRESHKVVGHARSADGRTGWSFTPKNAPALTPDDFEDWHMGAFRWDEILGRFEAWGRGGGGVSARHVSGPNDPANWSVDDPLTLDPAGLQLTAAEWAPESVVVSEGRYYGWFSHRTGRGLREIYVATSDDGIEWVVEPLAVLDAGESGEWDGVGVWSPSVTKADGFYVMAYSSQRFGEPAEIGLAASTDGLAWVRHRNNPVVTGQTRGFDIDGVESPALVADAEALRIWYTAISTQVLPCEGDAPTTGQQRRIGFTSLHPTR